MPTVVFSAEHASHRSRLLRRSPGRREACGPRSTTWRPASPSPALASASPWLPRMSPRSCVRPSACPSVPACSFAGLSPVVPPPTQESPKATSSSPQATLLDSIDALHDAGSAGETLTLTCARHRAHRGRRVQARRGRCSLIQSLRGDLPAPEGYVGFCGDQFAGTRTPQRSAASIRSIELAGSVGSKYTVDMPTASAPRRLDRWSSTNTT